MKNNVIIYELKKYYKKIYRYVKEYENVYNLTNGAIHYNLVLMKKRNWVMYKIINQNRYIHEKRYNKNSMKQFIT